MKHVLLLSVAVLTLASCVSGSNADSADATANEERNFGRYHYTVDEFTGKATLTYQAFFFAGYPNIEMSYTNGQNEFLLTLYVVQDNWIFADRVLYLIGDRSDELPVHSYTRDVTARGNVIEQVFVYLDQTQLQQFQTDEQIRFSLRGSRGRRDTHPTTTGPVFQEMLWRIVAAKPHIDAGEPVPYELLERFIDES